MNHDIVTISAAHDNICHSLFCIMIAPPSQSRVILSSSGDGDRRGDITEITSTDLMRELRIMSMGALDTVNSDHHQHSTHPVKSIVYNLGIADKRNV